MESSAARQRGEREAPDNTKSVWARRSAARSVVGMSTSSNDALVSGLIELILLTPVSMICGAGGSSSLSLACAEISAFLDLLKLWLEFQK